MSVEISLQGETALVTGASRGIGQAIAHMLAQAGAYVIGTATSEKGAEAISQGLAEAGLQGEGRVLNVSDPASIEALLADIKDKAPSILVNNAGITRDTLLMRMKDEDWDAVIETNLGGVFRLSRGCLRSMMKARKGRIINVTSIVGVTGNPGQANYVASKAGVIGFSKSLAQEVGSRGITVNAVAPGYIDTDMTRSLSEAHMQAMIDRVPLGRAGLPEDIAHAVLFLASPAAAYVTGETIHVNGGMHMA